MTGVWTYFLECYCPARLPLYYRDMGFGGLKVTGKEQGCVAVWISDSIFCLFYFTPTLTGRCNALPKKAPKELYKIKDMQQIRDEDVSFILSFIYWVQQPFRGWGSFSWIHWNGWIPHLRCQKYVNRFMHVFVLIWYSGLP